MTEITTVGSIKESVNTNNEEYENPDEELSFVIWKAGLNKELMSFWRSMEE